MSTMNGIGLNRLHHLVLWVPESRDPSAGGQGASAWRCG